MGDLADTTPAVSTADSPVSAPDAAVPTPTPSVPVRSVQKEKLRKALLPAQQKVLEQRDQSRAKGSEDGDGEGDEPAAADAVSVSPSIPAKPDKKPAVEAKPASQDEGERVSFGEESPADAAAKDGAGAEDHGLTPEQLKLLGEDVRKKVIETSKEAAKVRKRAQEAETRAAEAEKARDEALTQLRESQTRGGLVGNTFAEWKDAQDVSNWAAAGKGILAQFGKIGELAAAGDEVPADLLQYKLPNGQAMKLDAKGYDAAESWVQDAQRWQDYTEKAGKYKDSAKPVVDKHAKLDGYEAARKAIMDDPHVTARIEELAAKAAFYDVLNARKAQVIFGKAGAASNAPTSKAAEVQARAPANTPTPPRESAASTPRLAPADQAGNADRSQAKAQAMKSGHPDDIKAALLAVRRRGPE